MNTSPCSALKIDFANNTTLFFRHQKGSNRLLIPIWSISRSLCIRIVLPWHFITLIIHLYAKTAIVKIRRLAEWAAISLHRFMKLLLLLYQLQLGLMYQGQDNTSTSLHVFWKPGAPPGVLDSSFPANLTMTERKDGDCSPTCLEDSLLETAAVRGFRNCAYNSKLLGGPSYSDSVQQNPLVYKVGPATLFR